MRFPFFRVGVLLLVFAYPASPSLKAQSPPTPPETLVIYDTLASGKTAINGRTPDKANAPGGNWLMFRDDFNEDAFAYTGIFPLSSKPKPLMGGKGPTAPTPQTVQDKIAAFPQPALWLPSQRNGNAMCAISIASQGSYVKPPRFTISADIGGYRQANAALGFFPSAPTLGKNFYVAHDASYKNLYQNFTGLILTTWDHPDITLPPGADHFDFVTHGVLPTDGHPQRVFDEEGAPNGSLTLFEHGKAMATVKYTGTFDEVPAHRLSYDVDTTTGAISNVNLSGSTSDYSTLKSSAFTDAATAYAGIGVANAPDGTASETPPHQPATMLLVNNFRVGVNLGPTLPLPDAPAPAPVKVPSTAPTATPTPNAPAAIPAVTTPSSSAATPASAAPDTTPVVAPSPVGTQPLKVFLLAGQSNMMGFGARTGQLPADLKAPKDVLVFQGGAWIPLQASTFKNGCGPEFSFGQAMAEYLGEPVGIIKVIKPLEAGQFAASLAKGWTPDAPQGPLYMTLVQEIKDSQKDRPIVVMGMLWDQGSADQMQEFIAPFYQQALTHFIESIRKDAGNPTLPFVCGQENDHRGNEAKNPHIDLIRKAEAAINVPGYRCFNQDDLPRVDNTPPANGPIAAFDLHNDHYTTAGQIESGKRYAVVMIDLLKAAGTKTNGPVPTTSQPIAAPVTASPTPPVTPAP